MAEYIEFKDSWYCKLHKLSFKKDSTCPKCTSVSNGAYGASGTFLKDKTINDFTSNSQAITSNSQGVVKRKYVRKINDSIIERFHNFGVKFDAVIFSEALFNYPIYNLNNNVSYRRIDFPEAIVKIFKKSILITLRSSAEIKGLSVHEAESISINKINNVLDNLPSAIKVTNRETVNVHNAFINHPFAKKNVSISINNEKRFISDNSHGVSEFEAVNPRFAVSDSEHIESDMISLIDKGLSRDFLADSINELIKDRGYYAENLKSHVKAIQELSIGISKFNSLLSRPKGFSPNFKTTVSDLLPSGGYQSNLGEWLS